MWQLLHEWSTLLCCDRGYSVWHLLIIIIIISSSSTITQRLCTVQSHHHTSPVITPKHSTPIHVLVMLCTVPYNDASSFLKPNFTILNLGVHPNKYVEQRYTPCCWDSRVVLHNSNSEKNGWVSFQEKLGKRCTFAVINHTVPETRIFWLHFCCRHGGSTSKSYRYGRNDTK